MKRADVLAILAAHQERLKALGVKSLDLFGSVARDDINSGCTRMIWLWFWATSENK
ncbi:MAG: hypothetical protein ACBR15_18400 [Microcoleus sp.]